MKMVNVNNKIIFSCNRDARFTAKKKRYKFVVFICTILPNFIHCRTFFMTEQCMKNILKKSTYTSEKKFKFHCLHGN